MIEVTQGFIYPGSTCEESEKLVEWAADRCGGGRKPLQCRAAPTVVYGQGTSQEQQNHHH